MRIFTRFIQLFSILLLLFFVLTDSTIAAKEKQYAQKGIWELGGTVQLSSIWQVSNGKTYDATTVFSLSPYIGYFIDDGFELGLNPFGIVVADNFTQVNIIVSPAYVFKTQSNIFPFVQGYLGLVNQKIGSVSESGYSWGLSGGIKVNIAGNALMTFGLIYLQNTLNPPGASNRYGMNSLALTGGVFIFL